VERARAEPREQVKTAMKAEAETAEAAAAVAAAVDVSPRRHQTSPQPLTSHCCDSRATAAALAAREASARGRARFERAVKEAKRVRDPFVHLKKKIFQLKKSSQRDHV
jgi:hypothetical protein